MNTMSLQDPVAVYSAAGNVEAHLVKMALIEANIEAFVSEDLSTGGLWMFGTLPEIHKPQVWVSQSDWERARAICEKYEADARERRKTSQAGDDLGGASVKVLCEECGEESIYPAVQRGSVQDCPRCGAYVDVGEVAPNWLAEDENNTT
jgi:hypothetical protein